MPIPMRITSTRRSTQTRPAMFLTNLAQPTPPRDVGADLEEGIAGLLIPVGDQRRPVGAAGRSEQPTHPTPLPVPRSCNPFDRSTETVSTTGLDDEPYP